MYVCYCRAVTDDVIKDAIDEGARSIAELAQQCGAGGRCKGCWPALQELIAERSARTLSTTAS